MSGARFLLLFVGADDAPREWLRLRDGAIVARGSEPSSIMPMEGSASERVVLIAPGVDVALHWAELPSLSVAQGLAAARLIAAEISAAPLERLHVALGNGGTDRLRCVAVADAERVARWIGQAKAIGFDPDHILPEPLLILPPAEGVRRWERDRLHLLRGDAVALAAEPALAELVVGADVQGIEDAKAECEMGDAISAMPVDLRQGSFAKRRQWRVDGGVIRRLAAITAAITAATLMIPAALLLRYTFDTERLERETVAIARTVLPRAETPAPLKERLAELRGGGLGFSATAGLLFAAVRDTANVELGTLVFDRDGSLRTTVLAPSEADIAALRRRLENSGFAVESGEAHAGGGRQIAEFMMRPR
jgi:general secretion pathway protein L